MNEYAIKVREVGKKAWAFLARNGTNRLRIHAVTFTKENAEKLIAENAADNPGWEWKVVKLWNAAGTPSA